MKVVNYGDGKKFQKCKCTKKEKIWNPVYKKYKREKKRREPRYLRVYVATFIVKKGYRKKHLHVSHQCHRNKPSERCIEATHLTLETKRENFDRTMTCMKVIDTEKKKRHISEMGFGTITCGRCHHDPKCFFNVGRSRK